MRTAANLGSIRSTAAPIPTLIDNDCSAVAGIAGVIATFPEVSVTYTVLPSGKALLLSWFTTPKIKTYKFVELPRLLTMCNGMVGKPALLIANAGIEIHMQATTTATDKPCNAVRQSL